jgi:putative membrane protein
VLVEVPAPRLLASVLLRQAPIVVPLAVVFVASGVLLGSYSAAALLPLAVAAGSQFYALFVRNFGFTVAESPDGLRVRAGLLDTRAQTVPPGRVQAVRIFRPLTWRLFTDWAMVQINVAGYSGQQGEISTLLLPVGTAADVARIVARLLPGADVASLDARSPLLVPAPRAARWLGPLGWKGLGAGLSADAFLTRKRLLSSELVIVPHAKVQSVRIVQGPLQRRLGLATFAVDVAQGPASASAPHRLAVEAAALAGAETAAARRARLAAPGERWMVLGET